MFYRQRQRRTFSIKVHRARLTQQADFCLDLSPLSGYFDALFLVVASEPMEKGFYGAKDGKSEGTKSREEIALSLARPVRVKP
jgi:hypothetical protein